MKFFAAVAAMAVIANGVFIQNEAENPAVTTHKAAKGRTFVVDKTSETAMLEHLDESKKHYSKGTADPWLGQGTRPGVKARMS